MRTERPSSIWWRFVALVSLLILFRSTSSVAAAQTSEAAWHDLDTKAMTLFQQGKHAEAIAVTEDALRRAVQQFGPDSLNVAKYQHNLAKLDTLQHRYGEAELLYAHALVTVQGALGPDHPQAAAIVDGYVALLQKMGRNQEAASFAIHSRQLRSNLLNQMADQSEALFQQQRYPEAAAAARQTIQLAERELGPNDPDVATYLNDLATIYYTQGNDAEAQKLYRRALTILEQAGARGYPTYPTMLENYALSLRRSGNVKEADKLDAKAKRIRSTTH